MNVTPTAAAPVMPSPTSTPRVGQDLVGAELVRIAPSPLWNDDVVVRGTQLLGGPVDGFASVSDARSAIAQYEVPVTGSQAWHHSLVVTAQVGDRFVNVLGDAPAEYGSWDQFPVARTRDDRVVAATDLIVRDPSTPAAGSGDVYTDQRPLRGADSFTARAKDQLGELAGRAGEATVGRVLDAASWG